ncbi:MAG: hypothetical protein AB8F95_09655 [Bacteroidia bacterium]
MKKKLVGIVTQIFPVTVGVFLGFLVSNWADSRKEHAQTAILIENLQLEIISNKAHIESVQEYHRILRDSSRHYSNPDVEMGEGGFFRGTRIFSLSNSAYQTGIQTGIITELPISKIQALNQLYTLQSTYNDFGKMLLTNYINKDFSDKEEELRKIARFLAVTMTDVVIQEHNLIEGYDSMEQILKTRE